MNRSWFLLLLASVLITGCSISLHDQKNNLQSFEGLEGKTNLRVGVYNFTDKTNGDNGTVGPWTIDNIPVYYADLMASVLADANYFKSVQRVDANFNTKSAQQFDIVITGYVNTLKADTPPYAWNFINPVSAPALIGIPSAYCYREGYTDMKIVIADPKTGRPLDEMPVQSKYGNDGAWCTFWWARMYVRSAHDKLAGIIRTDLNEQVSKAIKGDLGQLLIAMDPNSASYFGKSQQVTAGVAETASSSGIAPAVKSDVDDLPAIKPKSRKNSYAVVVGIEKYRQKLPAATYATQDARTMTEYLTKVLGYPEENVITMTNENATKSDFEKYFERWLPNNVEKDGSVFIYYSGHGAPNPKSGDAYLVPYDGDPTFIDQTGYSLKRMYESLGKLKAKEVVVALDSCFSGAGGKSVLAEGARPLVMNLEKNATIPKNMVILSASSGEQISSTYKEKGHGLFTYYLLKGIKGTLEEDKFATLEIGELYNYLKPQVEKISRKQYNSEQTPQLIMPDKALEKKRLL